MKSDPNTKQSKAIVICGPTGIGKTTFAIDLAEAFQGEIIGADSMQIYRQMDIGTAKPTPDERAKIVHHMVDIVDPDEPFDAESYAKRAMDIIKSLADRQILPVVAGGTGLYIKALEYGLFDAPPVDNALRERLKTEAQNLGTEALLQRLKQVDPVTAEKVHPNDTYRITRALEIFKLTGLPISAKQRRHQFQEKRLNTLKLGLKMERQALYDRIDRRVDMMISNGLLDEVRELQKSGYSADLKSMQSIGYRHMADYLAGQLDWSRAIETLKRDTRRYAKRQFTWFRADNEIVWIDPIFTPDVSDTVKRFIV
jgi:tRNA dimethylallyltransferase